MSALNNFSGFSVKQLKGRISWIQKLIARDGADRHRHYARELDTLKAELSRRL